MAQIYVVRHGNTFDKGDIVTRVGARTDLPLSVSGLSQARALAHHFKDRKIRFGLAFCSRLQRTHSTAEIILRAQNSVLEPKTIDFLTEIDYGPDENKPEDVVVARVGPDALTKWETQAIAPTGWNVDPKRIVSDWNDFFCEMQNFPLGHNVLVVTSNGIARFALKAKALRNVPALETLKLKTGAFGKFSVAGPDAIELIDWNIRP